MKISHLSPIVLISMLSLIACNLSDKSSKTINSTFRPGEVWYDSDSVPVNAHGGGILYYEGVYYWFGEHKIEGTAGNIAYVGVRCYSSKDLYNWTNEGVALSVIEDDPEHDITRGCILERPKVIYNARTRKFVMWFHLELKDQGYKAARSGVAVADKVTGPYKFLESFRPDLKIWPLNVTEKDKELVDTSVYNISFTGGFNPEEPQNVNLLGRDFTTGQMARDMTLFVDDDGTAYQIYASEENRTLHISQLTDDYLKPAGKYVRVFEGRYMEAPVIFKHNGKYYFIGSGCTGWNPNAARSAVAESIWGPWTETGNPCIGPDSELTFHSQSTFVLPVQGREESFIFMADRWNPQNAIDGRYIWLPISFNNNKLIIKWMNEWDLSYFDATHKSSGQSGIVAAGERPSVLAGLEMLKKGGTAADAAAAAILALAITDYGLFCIGGEVPLLYYDAGKKEVKVFCGQGTAPLNPAAIEWYMKNGITGRDIKTATVPGVIDLCITVMKEYGKLSFADVSAPAIALLQDTGEAWYPDLEKTFRLLVEAESNLKGTRTEKLQAVSDRFYRGDIADSLDKYYRSAGGFLTRKDLEAHRTRIEKPVSIQYKGYTIYKCNSWTQGPTLLQSLKLLDQFEIQRYTHLSADYVHLVTEVLKLSLADRDRWYGDPDFESVPLEKLLSDEYASIRSSLVDMSVASDHPRPGDPVNMKAELGEGEYLNWDGGTTTCCVADKWGNVVAATPSGWGSTAGAAGSTGITHGTRLISLNTTPGHPNCIKPGKRPRITLTPTLILKNNKPVMAISVAGGDVQDQTTLNLVLDILEYGISPEEAVSVPRFSTNLHEDSFNPSSDRSCTIAQERLLTINSGLDSLVIRDLEKKGHKLIITDNAIGAPDLLFFDEKTDTWIGATDPKINHYTGALR
jgi:gamma-glutamyltranspeptidase/glutathione hydrolase